MHPILEATKAKGVILWSSWSVILMRGRVGNERQWLSVGVVGVVAGGAASTWGDLESLSGGMEDTCGGGVVVVVVNEDECRREEVAAQAHRSCQEQCRAGEPVSGQTSDRQDGE